MAYTKAKRAELNYLYKKYNAEKDPELQQVILAKIKALKTGLPATQKTSADEKLSWKRQYSKSDEQKKQQGVDAYSFLMERKRESN